MVLLGMDFSSLKMDLLQGDWLDMRVDSCMTPSLHSSNELGEHLLRLCYDHSHISIGISVVMLCVVALR